MALIRCPHCHRTFDAPTIDAAAGGRARAAKLSPEVRSASAQKASLARWEKTGRKKKPKS